MELIPLGRNIIIEFLVKEGEESSPILLPSDYRPADTPYEVVRVASEEHGNQCDLEWDVGDLVVVEAHMIRQFTHDEVVYNFITENHIIGWFAPDPEAEESEETDDPAED